MTISIDGWFILGCLAAHNNGVFYEIEDNVEAGGAGVAGLVSCMWFDVDYVRTAYRGFHSGISRHLRDI